MSSTAITWIVLGVIVVVRAVDHHDLQRARGHAAAGRTRPSPTSTCRLKQRHDLIPNLVETVKGYAGARARHARSGGAGAQRRDHRAGRRGRRPGRGREHAVAARCGSCSRCREAYPDLKANQNFQQLQAELSDIENKIAAARRFFNNAVQEYNTGIQQFPAVLLAGLARLHAAGVLRRRRRGRARCSSRRRR